MTTFFVSYTGADLDWAAWIAWELEADGHRAILQAWDFLPGMNFLLEMDRAAREADHMIAVLSPAYVDANFTQPEWAAAVAADATGQDRRLIPVRVQPVELTGLVRPIIYIDLVGKSEKEARAELKKGIAGGRAKPVTRVPFPGSPQLGRAPIFPGESAGGPASIRDLPDIDPEETLRRARGLIPKRGAVGAPTLYLALAGAPRQRVLRPAEMDGSQLADDLTQEGLFGSRVLAAGQEYRAHVEGGRLLVEQRTASIAVDEFGSICVGQSALGLTGASGLSSVIEEDLHERIERGLLFVFRALDRLDRGAHLTAIGIAAALSGAHYSGWRTRAEHAASPHSLTIPWSAPECAEVDLGELLPRRLSAVTISSVAEDLLTLLRREMKA